MTKLAKAVLVFTLLCTLIVIPALLSWHRARLRRAAAS